MERDSSEGIKGLSSFSDPASAGLGSLPAGEGWNRMHCRRAGRPCCGGEKNQTSISGGYERHEIMKTNKEESRGGEPLNLRGMTMLHIASYILKAFGIEINGKVLLQLEVA